MTFKASIIFQKEQTYKRTRDEFKLEFPGSSEPEL